MMDERNKIANDDNIININ